MTRRTPEAPWASPEAGLLSRACSGDGAAIESFVRWAWPRAHRVAYLLTHDRAASEDAAQEATLAAVRALPTFDLSREPGPWLERIAANKALDFLRKRQRRHEAELFEEQLTDDTTQVEELAALVDASISADVMDAFGTLALEQRQSVVLRHLLDYQPVEIADMLAMPAPTVRTHIHRGLRRLREHLEERERRSA